MSDTLLTLHHTDRHARPVTYLRAAELAQRWATTSGALAQMRYRGTGPDFIRIPGVGVRYDLATIEAYERAGQ